MEVKVETDSNDAMKIKTEADGNDVTVCSQNVGPSMGTFGISVFISSENGINSFIVKLCAIVRGLVFYRCVMHNDMSI